MAQKPLEADLACARDLARDLVVALGRARKLDHTHDRARVLARALDHARALDRDLALDQARELAYDLVIVMEKRCSKAERLLRTLEDPAPKATGQQDTESVGRPPGKAVQVLATAACRILPASARDRYAQEFYVELFDLPRRHRAGHALRLLYTAPAVRLSLQTTLARRGARP